MSEKLTAFLNKMREEGAKVRGQGSGQGIVGRVLIEFGLHRYIERHNFWDYWASVNKPEEITGAAAKLSAELAKAGCTDAPNFGVRITVFSDVLSASSPYKKDLIEFIPDWQEDAFSMILKTVDENELPVGEVFYGHVQYKANPFSVKKGEAGKTDKDQNGNPRYPTIRVPVRKFANEAEARAYLASSKAADNAGNNQWGLFSEKAKQSYTDVGTLRACAEEIHQHLQAAKGGTPFTGDSTNFPLPKPATPPALKKYIADIYAIEPGDIDLLEVAF